MLAYGTHRVILVKAINYILVLIHLIYPFNKYLLISHFLAAVKRDKLLGLVFQNVHKVIISNLCIMYHSSSELHGDSRAFSAMLS